ncbi:MAG: glycerophosphodiester phosphodiesterase [Acidobacteriia bacterium]|nr:glycerophosphodiester phosphodiesterase [Terriglobia bacterium]
MTDSPLLLGHRGARASRRARENTPASFDLALEQGCDGFEFDVRLTACGRAVICHNASVKGVAVAKAGCAQLKSLPLLEEVLARYATRAFLDIELKVPSLESQLLVALREHPPERGYVVSSFLPEVVSQLRLRSASVPLGIICDQKKQLDHWRKLPVEYVIPHRSLITKRLVEEVHKAGKMLLAWTVNDKPSMLRLADWKVDGIISDQTERLAQAFG